MIRGNIEKALGALQAAEVRYLIVGGLAVVLHGHLRTTLDLDLVIQLDEPNVARALSALGELGYEPTVPVPMSQFADPAVRQDWVQNRNMIVFSLWHPESPTFKIDLFVTEPFDFETVYARSKRVNLGHTQATVVALEDLIALKRDAGRPQDLADIEALHAVRSREESQS